MEKWLEQFLEEKEISKETPIEIDGHFGITLQNVVEFILGSDKETQKNIKTKIVMIDFKNGDVMHFFKYIAEYMVTLVPQY